MEFPPGVLGRLMIDPCIDASSEVAPGWYSIIQLLDRCLSEIAPGYMLNKVSDHMGMLEYYVTFTSGDQAELGQILIDAFCMASTRIDPKSGALIAV